MQSMTGYGQGEAKEASWSCRVEVHSVNRKQLDPVFHVPKFAVFLERPLRTLVTARFSRGRVSLKVLLESDGDARMGQLKVSTGLARQYLDHHVSLVSDYPESLAPLDLTRATGVYVLEEQELEPDAVWPVVEKAAVAALEQLTVMRLEEGKHLQGVLEQGVRRLEAIVVNMIDRAPAVVSQYRDALSRRLEEAGLPLPLDDERLVKEIGLFAERSDISEELDRLNSHTKQMAAYMQGAESVGRSIDFLAQEMNREFNTIGSKSNDATLTQLVVQAKTEVEKIREQVQNVE